MSFKRCFEQKVIMAWFNRAVNKHWLNKEKCASCFREKVK